VTNHLAINGGARHISQGAVLPSPPTTELDEQYVLQSLRSGVHSWGENCDQLEKEWAAWNGNAFCSATTSGTSALHMALVGCGMRAGDEVLTPAYSWTSSATCILHGQGIPVFVDTDPIWANIDPAKIEGAITPQTKGILVVHLHGVPTPMDEIMALARKHGLFVVEDACQAHGATYKGKKVGTIGDAAAFSLNQNKMLSAGEGGLFVTNDEEIFERGRSLVLFGDFATRGEELDENRAHGLGLMCRYNELCAAYARAQLTQLDDGIEHARAMFAVLREKLVGLPGLILPQEPEWGSENAYNFVCHLDPAELGYDGPVNFLREAVVSALQAEGAPVGVWQRRILPELSAIKSRNAYGNGAPWRESGSAVSYDPAQFPAALYHSASYFIFSNLRHPNSLELAHQIAGAAHKVWDNFEELDIEALAQNSDVSIYERGWQPHIGELERTEALTSANTR
jgi:dTDP-4-amino-4,6-dideoxygalactose transaminase